MEEGSGMGEEGKLEEGGRAVMEARRGVDICEGSMPSSQSRQSVGQQSTNNRVIADTGSCYMPAFHHAIFSTHT